MAASVESSDGDLGFQIAPMVDVVFVLMLFFMAIVGAEVITKEMKVLLPNPHSGSAPTVAIVDIAADGSVLFNGEPMGIPQDAQLTLLREKFRYILQQFGDKDAVMIRPVPSIRHERVVEVLSAVQGAGVSKVTFL
jgi:biopolymer transport protein ExbD